MRHFDQQLTESVDELDQDYSDPDMNPEYIDPDVLWCDGTDLAGFIYNPDGSIFYSHGNDFFRHSHVAIMADHIGYYANLLGFTYDPELNHHQRVNMMYAYNNSRMPREQAQDVCLLGRAGVLVQHRKDQRFVSFWNTNLEIYDALLEDCLSRLEADGMVTQDTRLALPHLGVVPIHFRGRAATVNQDQLETVKQRQILHLMPPDQKRQALRQLGYQGSTKNPWQQAGEEAELVQPGHKLWAMTSESRAQLQILQVDPEDWEIADQAEQITKASGLRISSNKDLTLVALLGDEVVGAIWSDFAEDKEVGAWCYDFDVAVAPEARTSGITSLRIGPQLIDAALNHYRQLRTEYGHAYISVWVINSKLARYLEDRYGFETAGGDWTPTNSRMYYYGD